MPIDKAYHIAPKYSDSRPEQTVKKQVRRVWLGFTLIATNQLFLDVFIGSYNGRVKILEQVW